MRTQEQYSVLRQPVRRLNIRIDLLNEKDVVLDSFEGITTSGNISISGDSTYRRSGNMTMVFDKKYNLIPSASSKIWFNRRCAIYIGVKNYLDETVWFNLGRFAMTGVSLNLSGAEKTLSCQLADYMVFLDGSLGGRLSHQTVIPANTVTVNEALRTTLTGLTRFSLDSIQVNGSDAIVPYTIEKSAGSSVYDLVKELVELYMDYDFYFDENGYFIVEKIKNRKNDPVVEVFDSSDKDFSLNSSSTFDFKNVRNSVFVWGRQLEDGTQIKYSCRNRWCRPSVSYLSGLSNKENGDICYIKDVDKSYIWNGSSWDELDFNVVPEFNVEQIGEKIWTYTDDKIFTKDQAMLRSFFELKQYSNFAETISFDCVPIYYLKPMNKIHVDIDGVLSGDYLISNVSVPLDIFSPMNIQAYKLYF